MNTRVLIADDHGVVREGLRSLIDAQLDMRVVSEARDGLEAVELAVKHRPEVVVMDIGMPRLNGVEATRRALAEAPGVRILALSMHSERRFVLDALHAGASGYLLKDSIFAELAEAIRTVAGGRTFLSPQIAGVVVDGLRSQTQLTGPKTSRPVLSSRERQALQLIAEGMSAKEIASLLHLSVKTVESHRRQIMEKLEIDSVAQLVRYAIREGITPLDD